MSSTPRRSPRLLAKQQALIDDALRASHKDQIGNTVACKHNCNQPIYLALIHKANSCPPEKVYPAKLYRDAALSVALLDYNLYSNPISDDIPCRIKKFILDYIGLPIIL